MPMQTRARKEPTRAIRLTFTYEGDRIRLESRRTLAMRTPPSDPLEAGDASGFWYELQDGREHTLYRRVAENPVRFAVEYRTEDPARPLAWQPVEEPRGRFVLLVPELAAAETVALFSSPLDPGRALEPAVELARFQLRDDEPQEGER